MPEATRPVIAVFAHNEQRRIAACLESLPVLSGAFDVHVLVNGSTDATAVVVRTLAEHNPHLQLHELPTGGKARTWNHFVDLILPDCVPAAFFVDGDTVILPGAIEAMLATLDATPDANGVNALPVAGRNRANHRNAILAEHGIFGGLYGLSGAFIARLKASNIRLPIDLVGDDGLVGALAKTDLGRDAGWRNDRIANCPAAEFACEETDLRSPASIVAQCRRMINYSVRRYQNIIITQIMQSKGAQGLPLAMRDTYRAHWHRFGVRPAYAPFDLLAKRRMKAQLAI